MKKNIANTKLLLIFSCILFLIPVINLPSKPVGATNINLGKEALKKDRKADKFSAKLQKKFNRVKTKIKKFAKQTDEKLKATRLKVLGITLLLIGIILIIAALIAAVSCLDTIFLLTLGVGVIIGGCVVLNLAGVEFFHN